MLKKELMNNTSRINEQTYIVIFYPFVEMTVILKTLRVYNITLQIKKTDLHITTKLAISIKNMIYFLPKNNCRQTKIIIVVEH